MNIIFIFLFSNSQRTANNEYSNQETTNKHN